MEIKASTLEINKDITVNAPDSALSIIMDQALPIGDHFFQLVVVDDAGNPSAPAKWRVTIADTRVPTAKIGGPEKVEFGDTFILTGKESSDVPPGKVAKYIWTKVAQ
jgi:hypothetical protein